MSKTAHEIEREKMWRESATWIHIDHSKREEVRRVDNTYRSIGR